MALRLVEGLAAVACAGALLIACGGSVSLGDTGTQQQGSTSTGPRTEAGETLCPRSDCANQGMACTGDMPRNLRCVDTGTPYEAVGNRCRLLGDCSAVGDSGAALPRVCEVFPPVGPCAEGDICRQDGLTTGWAEASCYLTSEGGTWHLGYGH